jgi:hypothetical protein
MGGAKPADMLGNNGNSKKASQVRHGIASFAKR